MCIDDAVCVVQRSRALALGALRNGPFDLALLGHFPTLVGKVFGGVNRPDLIAGRFHHLPPAVFCDVEPAQVETRRGSDRSIDFAGYLAKRL